MIMSYRVDGDRDVEVLSSIVLLERVDIKPNLKNQTHTFKSTIKELQSCYTSYENNLHRDDQKQCPLPGLCLASRR